MRQQTTIDDRGQLSSKRAVQLVVALAVFGIIASVLAPVALDAITEDDSDSFTGVALDETVEAKGGILNVTVTTINDTSNGNEDLNVTVEDTTTGNTVDVNNTNTGASQEATLSGETITITNDGLNAAEDAADFTIAYPSDFGWSSGATSLWGILDLAIVLVLFLFVVGWAMLARSNSL